jgi:hypothetical protein
MEKAYENGDVFVGRIISCTPAQLRIIADRLELAANQNAYPKEICLYPLVPGITLQYEPFLTRSAILSRIVNDNVTEQNDDLQETHLQ